MKTYRGEQLNHVAFPMGGIGAGMICLEGVGALSHVSLRHQPEVFNEPQMFAALFVKGALTARVLEGPVPGWKVFSKAGGGDGARDTTYGLPRFADCQFSSRYPFATVKLSDPTMPVSCELVGWSPCIPNETDDSSLPVCGLEYRLTNTSGQRIEAVWSYHCPNLMRTGPKFIREIRRIHGGFVVGQMGSIEEPAAQGHFAMATDDPAVAVDCAPFRSNWWEPFKIKWKHAANGDVIDRAPHTQGDSGWGASLYVPFELDPGQSRTIRLRLAWYVPYSKVRAGRAAQPVGAQGCTGEDCCKTPEHHQPWYAGRFASIDGVCDYWKTNYDPLRERTGRFSDCLYDSTLPAEVIDAVTANLSILQSPTCLRDVHGRFWAWEGCSDKSGCCHGTCNHVWNYAQALPHLFARLERTLRQTEYGPSQDERGHQTFRANLPISPTPHEHHAAADGQLGGIMKLYRDWRISGDQAWLATMWPAVRQSMAYCIDTWDPDHTGTLVEPHHNTYDIEFWGPDGMCTSIYLGALAAMIPMAKAVGESTTLYQELLAKGRAQMHEQLWNGSYFFQVVRNEGLRAKPQITQFEEAGDTTPEVLEIVRAEGPRYQYGNACLSDGIVGDWMARVSGIDTTLDTQKVRSHLLSVFENNFKTDLTAHACTQRPGYALGKDGGLLVCSWPQGGERTLPFPYTQEVFTGIEYHVAAHLIMLGEVEKGLAIVRAARARYDGRVRNPFDEYECGHWYARAMSSYSLLQAFTGARYDAVEQVLHLAPQIDGDFRSFLCTASGYGTVGMRDGKPFCDVVEGVIPIRKIQVESH